MNPNHVKVQPETGMTKAALNIQLSLSHPINIWVFSKTLRHCPRGQRVLFPSYSSQNMLRTPKRTGPTDDFQLWFCITSQPKGNHKAPKSKTSYMFIMVWHFFFQERGLGCHNPPKLTIIKLDTTPSFGISFKSCEMINQIPTFTL